MTMSRINFKYINMSHWGHLCLLPHLDLVVVQGYPTIQLEWWIWRVDIEIWYQFPDWFMKYVWSTVNFDFGWLKKQKEEYDY